MFANKKSIVCLNARYNVSKLQIHSLIAHLWTSLSLTSSLLNKKMHRNYLWHLHIINYIIIREQVKISTTNIRSRKIFRPDSSQKLSSEKGHFRWLEGSQLLSTNYFCSLESRPHRSEQNFPFEKKNLFLSSFHPFWTHTDFEVEGGLTFFLAS